MTEPLIHHSIAAFLDALAGSSPTPGGGSVAALSGAQGAALVSMVCNLTMGKKKYAAVQDEIAHLLEQSEALRRELTDLIQADVEAFDNVSAAYKLPQESEEQKSARTAAIQQALKAATVVPMRVAEACARVLDLCAPVAEKGNRNAVSDAGVAALMAEAGLRGAALNVLINLKAIHDDAFCTEMGRKLEDLLRGKPALKDEIYDAVVNKL